MLHLRNPPIMSSKALYKTLSSETLFAHPRLTVVEDQIETPDGQRGDYLWFAGSRGAVTIIARNDAGKVLVQQEYSYLPNAALYQFVGGGIEEGEQPEAAAIRELAEETSLSSGRLTLIGSYLTDHRRSRSRMHVFICENLEPCVPVAKDMYEVDLKHFWMSGNEIDSLIAGGSVANANMLASWMLYQGHK